MTVSPATVLIVDDEPHNRRLLEALLKPEGYLTLTADSGREALVLIAQQAPDLILLDVMMPDMDGFEVASILKADPATSNIPIIIVTASVDRNSRLAGLDAGAEDFLMKPVDRAELWLRVRNLLRLKALSDFQKNHSVILEQEVQARTASLRESERRFSDMLRNIELASVMLDRDARITFCNEYLLRLSGWAREDVIGRNWFELFMSSDASAAKDAFARLLDNTPEAWHRENVIVTRLGEPRLMRWNNSVLRSDAGDVIGSASIGEDITEHRRAEVGIRHMNRVYAVLSGINTLIVRVRGRDELFREACRIAVEEGGFRMAMICTVDQSTGRSVLVASSGVDEELRNEITKLLSSTELAPTTMIMRAISGKQIIVSNDSQNDPRLLLAKNYVESGIRSIALLPLIVADEAVGVIALYASETEFFHAEELKLLTELAGDVAFAIDHIEKQERLDYLAYYDTLTGLPNRTLFYATLRKTLEQATDSGWLVAVLCVDLDFFKNVNDTLGHAIGDELLSQVSARLVKCVRIRDTVGRLGGDEFALILTLPEGQDAAIVIAKKVRDALREPFELRGHEITVTASIGITISPDDASDSETLMKYADTAMYRAKQAGRDTFRFFTAQMNTEAMTRLDLETALRKAIVNGEFELHYQPKVHLDSGRITGLEALLRWQRPGHGLVMPGKFIPILEETGLIVRVGAWVIAAVCKQIGLWMHSWVGPMQVSVNVSGRQFIEGDLEADVINALTDNDVAAEQLELELTESSLMANTERTIATLQTLKQRGVQISVDDFGTGYSSLAYLRRFPIDKLKIDIAFVRDVTSNPNTASIVLAIIRMAHSLKMEVIAEGVETEAQLAYLQRHRCDHVQGYYFSPPLPLAGIEKMLREEKRLPARVDQAAAPRNTLLLVDDEEHVLHALQRLLRLDGYQILSARSAAEGFELLALHPVQVLLCDQLMPGMTGTDFLDRIKDLYPDTFRIVLSGHSDLETIVAAINRGAVYRFYTKPWDNKVLRDNIRAAFRHYWLLHSDASASATADIAQSTQQPAPGRNNGAGISL